MDATSTPFLTREQLLQRLNEHGFVISRTYFNKICLPSVNAGPPAAKQWGRRPLYKLDDALAWAEARCRPVAQRVAEDREAA